MIGVNNPVKQIFDTIVLLIVGYSCIMSLYNSAFEPIAGLGPGKSKVLYWWDMIVELIFYTDLMLSFF